MLEKIIIAVVPAMVSSIITYLLSTRTERSKSKFDSTKDNKIKFFDITRWIYKNYFKIMYFLFMVTIWYVMDIIMRHCTLYPFPSIGHIVVPALYILCTIIIFLILIDVIFNDKK